MEPLTFPSGFMNKFTVQFKDGSELPDVTMLSWCELWLIVEGKQSIMLIPWSSISNLYVEKVTS